MWCPWSRGSASFERWRKRCPASRSWCGNRSIDSGRTSVPAEARRRRTCPVHRTCGTVDRVSEYDVFSRFYDAVMDDPGPRADRVVEWIQRYRPHTTSLLELGCGTGSILVRLDSGPELTGIDQSSEMLARARAKVPRARLIEDDMKSFSLEERFDVVICVFDSLYHLFFFR